MLDLKWIRENPQLLDQQLSRRQHPPVSARILEIDLARRHVQTQLQEQQTARNLHAQKFAEARRAHAPVEDLQQEGTKIKQALAELEAQEKSLDEELQKLLEVLPNLPHESVPDGQDADQNQEVRQWGQRPTFGFAPQEHWALGEALGQMNFEAAATLSGSRFVVLTDDLARLERALAQFMLDVHTGTFGYREVAPPYLVRSEVLYGTGQLPKFGGDSFSTQGPDPLWLIATSEIALTNLVAHRILEEDQLPLRLVAHTPCFRSEAGAAGRDTRGMIRVHQFQKVELVSITTPEQAEAEHERMLTAAESILQKLNIHYRVMALCTGDMSASAEKTYDIEVWLPGQKAYREISSCSRCNTYQARRMQARYRPAGQDKPKSLPHVHTLNGSGLAVGRTLVAVLENYQNADGSITIPPVLRPYLNQQEVIKPYAKAPF